MFVSFACCDVSSGAALNWHAIRKETVSLSSLQTELNSRPRVFYVHRSPAQFGGATSGFRQVSYNPMSSVVSNIPSNGERRTAKRYPQIFARIFLNPAVQTSHV